MKCLISDYDGTFYDKNILKNIDAVNKFICDGNIFVINTGRTYESIISEIKKYNIPYNYLICSDGASIYDHHQKLYSCYLNDDIKKEIIELLSDEQTENIMYDNGYTITDENTQISRVFVRRINMDTDVKKVEELNKNSHLFAYLSKNWININNKKVNKLTGIKELQKIYNLGKIYTIGDSYNDIEMIKYYDGYVMEENDLEGNNIKKVSSIDDLIKKIS